MKGGFAWQIFPFCLIIVNLWFYVIQGTTILHTFVPYQEIDCMNVDNVRSQMRKGMLEYCILLLLHQEASYASDIIQKLKEAHLIVVEGTLYPLLTRLKNDNLLAYEWVESTQGPPRKYYSLTPDGEVFLQGLEEAWTELSSTVNHIKNQ